MNTKPHWISICLAIGLLTTSAGVQAGWWEETKAAAASAWESTKETTSEIAGSAWEKTKEVSSEVKEGAVETWEDATTSDTSSNSLSDVKKLADKETYAKAWEDIKHSAQNPADAEVDEHGVLKE